MDDTERTRQALDMLSAFAAVGVTHYGLTLTDLDGNKTDYRPNCSNAILRGHISIILKKSASVSKNVIIRPQPTRHALVQLDDLTPEAFARIRPVAFLTYRTSPAGYQAWLALAGTDGTLARHIKRAFGGDPSASGSTRICGSVNFKRKYGPDFPMVTLMHAAPARVLDPADLAGLVAVWPPPPRLAPPAMLPSPRAVRVRFPDYGQCLRKAPRRKDGQPDRSKADYFFCYLSAKWGWPEEAIAAELLRVSAKAAEKGAGYAILTAKNAATNARKHGGGGASDSSFRRIH